MGRRIGKARIGEEEWVVDIYHDDEGRRRRWEEREKCRGVATGWVELTCAGGR